MLDRVPDEYERERFRRSYDAVARDYESHFGDELSHKPLDRALLGALIEQTDATAAIADLGCGPGHVAAWLSDHGLAAVGIDLSPQMVEIGKQKYPQVDFRVGDLVSLPAADAEFGAAVAFYSIIHLQPSEIRTAFNEVHRTLRPGGLFLLSFHIGSGVIHRTDWWEHQVDIDFRFFEPDAVTDTLNEVGFVVEARLERSNYPEEAETRRAYLLARRQGS